MKNLNLKKWKDIPQRTLSAAVMIPIILFCLWWGGMVFACALWGIGMVAAWEWCRLVFQNQRHRRIQTGLYQCAVTSAVTPMFFGPDPIVLMIVLISVMILWRTSHFFVLDIYTDTGKPKRPMEKLKQTTNIPVIGIFYIALPILSLSLLRLDESHGFIVLLWMIMVVAVGDTMALFAGRALGGAKIVPKISPNKTWAGVVGLVIGAFVCGIVFTHLIGQYKPESPGFIAIISVIVALVAHGGDIFQSYVKRAAEVKDSGRLIPGHGGVLDRVDAHFTAAVFVLILGTILGGIKEPARAIFMVTI